MLCLLCLQAMATRQQGLFRHYSKAEVMAQDWDSLMLKVKVVSMCMFCARMEGHSK